MLDNDQFWVFMGVVCTQTCLLLGAIVAGWVKLKLQREDVRTAMVAAQAAEKQTVNTGNGFAATVREDLKTIKQGQAFNREQIAALRAEAAADRQVMIRHLEAHVPTSFYATETASAH